MHIKEEIQKKFNKSKSLLVEANQKFGGVFVSHSDEYDSVIFEVEVDEGKTAFSIKVAKSDLDGSTSDDVIVEINDYLESNGVSVFSDVGEWEDAKYSGE